MDKYLKKFMKTKFWKEIVNTKHFIFAALVGSRGLGYATEKSDYEILFLVDDDTSNYKYSHLVIKYMGLEFTMIVKNIGQLLMPSKEYPYKVSSFHDLLITRENILYKNKKKKIFIKYLFDNVFGNKELLLESLFLTYRFHLKYNNCEYLIKHKDFTKDDSVHYKKFYILFLIYYNVILCKEPDSNFILEIKGLDDKDKRITINRFYKQLFFKLLVEINDLNRSYTTTGIIEKTNNEISDKYRRLYGVLS